MTEVDAIDRARKGVSGELESERARIQRELNEGRITPTEHRRRARAIDRAEEREAHSTERAEVKREHKRRSNARMVLRRSLLRSLGRQSA